MTCAKPGHFEEPDPRCSGKIGYVSRREALKVVARIAKRVKRSKYNGSYKAVGNISVYRCPRCDGWHIGTDRSLR